MTRMPDGLNDRLLSMQLPLGKRTVTLISAYPPTMANADEVKEQLYEELDTLVASVTKSEKLFVLGEYNARVEIQVLKFGGGKIDFKWARFFVFIVYFKANFLDTTKFVGEQTKFVGLLPVAVSLIGLNH